MALRRFLASVTLVAAAAAGCKGERPASSANPGAAGRPARLGIGTPADPKTVAAWDVDVNGKGDGLPEGSGTVAQGAHIYATQCVACHGKDGEGTALGSQLIKPTTPGAAPRRNVASHWPYAPPLFDYIRRTMPPVAPGSLTDADVYAVVAYLLAANKIAGDQFVADQRSLAGIIMPSRDRFVPDDRRGGPEVK